MAQQCLRVITDPDRPRAITIHLELLLLTYTDIHATKYCVQDRVPELRVHTPTFSTDYSEIVLTDLSEWRF